MSFLKAQDIRGLAKKNDWSSYVEEEPEVYEQFELDELFAACDEHERLWFEFFLMTGMREQEVMHTYWDDVSLTRGTVTLRYKKEFGFSPKNYKEREIPIQNKLAQAIKDRKKSHASPSCPLLFPTSGCKPKLNFLDVAMAFAVWTGLRSRTFEMPAATAYAPWTV
jgi:integrase